jgi:hypothetical protein
LIDYYKHNDSSNWSNKTSSCYYGRFKTGFWKQAYDEELMAVMSFKKRNGYKTNKKSFDLASATNEHTIKKYISTIM